MAIVKSVQLTNQESQPRVLNPARDVDARVRSAYFSFFPTAEAAGSTIRLGTIKKGWRIRPSRVVFPVIGAAGATISIGVTGTVAKYMAATAVDAVSAVGGLYMAGTDALFAGEVVAADFELIATTAGGALLTSSTLALQIFFDYTRD